LYELLKKHTPQSIKNYFHFSREKIKYTLFRVKTYGTRKVFLNLLPAYAFYMISLCLSIPIAVFLYLLTPLIQIRLVRLLSERAGHFGLNTENMLCAFDVGVLNRRGDNHKIKYFFYTHGIVCNKQLLKMWKRVLPLLPFPIACRQIDQLLSFASFQYKKDKVKNTVESSGWVRDKLLLMERVPYPHVFFTFEEEKRAEIFLEKLGVSKNAKWVCLLVRDPLYLDKLFPIDDWDYHAHRNANIMTYKKAALFLAEKGYTVIRMGKWAQDPFSVSHERIIDYAMHPLRSDFLDIYLSAKCCFFMSTSTGIDSVAQMFRRPILFSNIAIPSELQSFVSNSLFIPKKVINKNTDEYITYKTFDQVISSPYEIHETAKKNNFMLVDNTEDEILEAAIEMEQRITCMWIETKIDILAQKKFFMEYPHYLNDVKDVRIKIGKCFLEQYFKKTGIAVSCNLIEA